MVLYTVRQGDSVYSISQQYGVPMQQIIDDNQLKNTEALVLGQSLVLMTDSVRHTVAPGESLYLIARRYETTVPDLLKANPDISDPQSLQVGQVLTIPVVFGNIGSAEVNGYALPTISQDTLKRTSPFLTYLSVFSYQARADGSLSSVDDTKMVELAKAQKAMPMMCITNIRSEGGFSSEIAHAVLTDESVQNKLLDNISGALGGGQKYGGLNIDFEYIYPRDRESYHQFLLKVVSRFRPLGYFLTTSLAPKNTAGQSGLLYEAHDYAVHGELMDRVILMTYEWGYTYGPARPVAPLNLVEKVIQYAVTEMPANKILMGMPNYGYDWTLPFVQGSSARSLTNEGAVRLAARVGARILFNPEAQSPFFTYYDRNGKKHEVWFEDARSIHAKLLLANRYGLAGVSYWTINTYFPQNWLVLNATFTVKKQP